MGERVKGEEVKGKRRRGGEEREGLKGMSYGVKPIDEERPFSQ